MRQILPILTLWLATTSIEAKQQPMFRVNFVALVNGEGALKAVEWEIQDTQEEFTTTENRRWTFTRDLPPGTYQVQARLNGQVRTTQFEVTTKQQEVRIHF